MKNNNTNVTKNSKKFYPPNDSGNRLYNYGYYIKNKLIKKRIDVKKVMWNILNLI